MSSSLSDRRLGQRAGIAVIAVTRGGARLGGEIAAALGESATLHVSARWQSEAPPGARVVEESIGGLVADLFPRVEGLILVLATGATVRLVAPLLGTKQDDPAVLAVDERGRHVVALLGGHQAQANALATSVADGIGATPVISTASDVLGLPALDLIGQADGWRLEADAETVKRASAAIVAGEAAAIFQNAGDPAPIDDLPPDWPRVSALAELRGWSGPRLMVTDRTVEPAEHLHGNVLVYRPPSLVLGVGCSLGAPTDEIEALARSTLRRAGLAWGSIGSVATIDRRIEEPGVVELAKRLDVPLAGYSASALAAVTDAPTPSAEVARHVGTPGVCEPAALLASQGGTLVIPKHRSAHATVAVARRAVSASRSGKLWLVGLGPGPLDLMTGRARAAIRLADAVIGYRAYLEPLRSIAAERRLRSYELGQERERAAEAIALGRAGRQVALVSSGDVGIYGMAGLVFELLAEESEDDAPPNLNVEVIPGVTAASAAAALLGAPLMLDFAAISLSDLLVPWESIRRRLLAAAEGDFVVVLYNPASARRRQPLHEALSIMRQYRAAETPVGLVREAYRADQTIVRTTLGEVSTQQIDMRTVMVIGCSRTADLGKRMVTRRGYLEPDRS